MSSSKLASALVVSCLASAAGAQAPAPRDSAAPPLTFGVGGGFAMHSPLRPTTPTDGLGYTATAQLELRTALRPLLLRGEGSLARWSNGERVSSLTAALVARPTARWRVLPYAVGGGGIYFPQGAGSAPGWTLGAGLQLPAGTRALFLESRLHAMSVGTGIERWRYTYSPLTLGIRF
ncbi:hypothetical protein [Roseisolibacter sp. H3M3-2]|uniref:hypothetical protein n=1 Tax=Roseisolibacter sp. H3M3-2 TaxID=3031323 RepID=UPI0023DCBF20|nr:hypothetical protein [Roseisolibacter sp. H3M3-2]MDF1504263.1 hypothetical protein [Roseisolibacter sp. H3M3-2]